MVGMVGGSADPAFDAKFREFLMEPGTQEVIASDQAKELGIMRETVLTRSQRAPQPCLTLAGLLLVSAART